jgi:uncharacterized coiled-coil protein SlyX
MKIKILSSFFAVVFVFIVSFSIVMAEETPGKEMSIPEQIEELKIQVLEIKDQITNLISTQNEVDDLKNTLASQQQEIQTLTSTVVELKTDVSNLEQELASLKLQLSSSSTILPEERLSFGTGGRTSRVNLYDEYNLRIPNAVIEVFKKNNPDDKLIGVTDYNGNVTFTLPHGEYVIIFAGTEKYRPTSYEMNYVVDYVNMKTAAY